MKIEWILLCEGIGQDAKGAITAIGLNQNVVVAQTLPVVTKRGFIARIAEYDLEVDSEVVFRFEVISPEGKSLSTQEGTVRIGESLWPELPQAIDLPAEFLFQLPSHGTYEIAVTVGFPDGTELQSSTQLYVLKPSLAS